MLPGPTVVPPYGPLDAPIAWVGESPGFEEERELRPFVGQSGQMARKALTKFGLSPDNDVRWGNCCPHKILPWPSNSMGDRLLLQFAPQLDQMLQEMTACKIIVCCGSTATKRLTGLTDLTSWWGSILRREDVPEKVQWHKSLPEWPIYWPSGAVCVPIWHPAGILRDLGREGTPEFLVTVKKMADYLAGRLQKPTAVNMFYPNLSALEQALTGRGLAS